MTYRITGLDPAPFRKFYGMSDDELATQGVWRYSVDNFPGYPDRVGMADMQVGDTALLLNFEHLPVDSPYRSCHAIYVREGADEVYSETGVVPDVMKRRQIALRGLDDKGFIVDAEIAEGDEIEPLIHKMFEDARIVYIQAYNAKRGCFSGLIERA